MLMERETALAAFEVSVSAFDANIDPGGERFGSATVTQVPHGFEVVAEPGFGDPKVIVNCFDVAQALLTAVSLASGGDTVIGVSFVDAEGCRVSISGTDRLPDGRLGEAIDRILRRI